MNRLLSCKLCLNAETELYCRKDSKDVFHCRNCGLIFAVWEPDEKVLEDHYSAEYFKPYLEDVAIHVNKRFKRRIREIRNIKRSGKLLDVGSGVGIFLRLAVEQGYDAFGVDISAWACEYARKKFNLKVFNGDFRKAGWAGESFDVITLWHVLEHVKNPVMFLNDINKLLKVDGILALEVPNIESIMAKVAGIDWELMAPKEHLFYFNIQTLKRVLGDAGFKVIQSKTYAWTMPDMIFRAKKQSSRGLLRLFWLAFSALTLPLALFRFMAMPDFFKGDVLTVYAVKNKE